LNSKCRRGFFVFEKPNEEQVKRIRKQKLVKNRMIRTERDKE
jgi:hypothetical protein